MTETSPPIPLRGIIGEPRKGKIGVLVEEHFDMTEFRLFNELFPKHGYQVVYLSHLWGNPALTFGSNPDAGWVEEHVLVETEIAAADPSDYKGIIIIGAYASDRLRYQVTPRKGESGDPPGACRQPSEDRHDLPQLVAAVRRPRAAAGPPGHLRPQHRL
jgi:protease I